MIPKADFMPIICWLPASFFSPEDSDASNNFRMGPEEKKKHGRPNIHKCLKNRPGGAGHHFFCWMLLGCREGQRKTFGSFGHTKPIAKKCKSITKTAN